MYAYVYLYVAHIDIPTIIDMNAIVFLCRCTIWEESFWETRSNAIRLVPYFISILLLWSVIHHSFIYHYWYIFALLAVEREIDLIFVGIYLYKHSSSLLLGSKSNFDSRLDVMNSDNGEVTSKKVKTEK